MCTQTTFIKLRAQFEDCDRCGTFNLRLFNEETSTPRKHLAVKIQSTLRPIDKAGADLSPLPSDDLVGILGLLEGNSGLRFSNRELVLGTNPQFGHHLGRNDYRAALADFNRFGSFNFFL
jgi:hypothetical protein